MNSSDKSALGSTVGLCTLAIHRPYRQRARRLISDQPEIPWTVLTDDPGDFCDLPARAIYHTPTGPMASDYLTGRVTTDGHGLAVSHADKFRAAAAYHDKRFALMAARERAATALFFDADARLRGGCLWRKLSFKAGLAAGPVMQRSIREHLHECGSWRLPHFEALADYLGFSGDVLEKSFFLKETFISFTAHPAEEYFFALWGKAAEFMQSRGVYTGEGGVIGVAAMAAGIDVDFESLAELAEFVQHEGGGPKAE